MDAKKQELTEAVGKRIRTLRHLQSISQEEVALRANLNPAYYGQVERGLKCPTIDTLYKIAQALGTSLPELLRTDAIPSQTSNYSHRVEELLARVPAEKQESVLKVLEDMIELL